MGDTAACFYQFIYDEEDRVNTKITQYFITHVFVLCIKVDSYVAHMLYVLSFSNNTAVPIDIMKNKYFLSLNAHTTLFDWGASISIISLT